MVLTYTQVLTDVANNQLQQVSWVIPSGGQSDHPLITNGSGPSWVASVVNAIGNSPYWANTAIFITWDDYWGGFYDHVSPNLIKSYEYGFRVPLIVVSPYAKAQYISKTTHDFGSIAKFREETFGLQSLGYADVAAATLPTASTSIRLLSSFKPSTPLKAAYFLNDKRPPTDPDDD